MNGGPLGKVPYPVIHPAGGRYLLSTHHPEVGWPGTRVTEYLPRYRALALLSIQVHVRVEASDGSRTRYTCKGAS